VRDERRAVRIGDRPHDGQPETVPATAVYPVGAELLERLEQPVELGWRDDRAGVLDHEPGAAGGDTGRDRDPAGVALLTGGLLLRLRDA
jgi:hypothetical protein